jgi:hypothetical protein
MVKLRKKYIYLHNYPGLNYLNDLKQKKKDYNNSGSTDVYNIHTSVCVQPVHPLFAPQTSAKELG